MTICCVRKIDFFFVNFVVELYCKSIINNFILSIMSKTTEIQIEKSRNLIEGLRRHVREMGESGISNNEIMRWTRLWQCSPKPMPK